MPTLAFASRCCGRLSFFTTVAWLDCDLRTKLDLSKGRENDRVRGLVDMEVLMLDEVSMRTDSGRNTLAAKSHLISARERSAPAVVQSARNARRRCLDVAHLTNTGDAHRAPLFSLLQMLSGAFT